MCWAMGGVPVVGGSTAVPDGTVWLKVFGIGSLVIGRTTGGATGADEVTTVAGVNGTSLGSSPAGVTVVWA